MSTKSLRKFRRRTHPGRLVVPPELSIDDVAARDTEHGCPGCGSRFAARPASRAEPARITRQALNGYRQFGGLEEFEALIVMSALGTCDNCTWRLSKTGKIKVCRRSDAA